MALDPFTVDDVGGPAEVDLGAVEVEVGPSQVQELAATGTGVGGEAVEGSEPVQGCMGQEHA